MTTPLDKGSAARRPIPRKFSFDRSLLSDHPFVQLVRSMHSQFPYVEALIAGDAIDGLYFYHVGLGDAGARLLADYIRICSSTMQSLSLMSNQIGVVGGLALARAIHGNMWILSCDTDDNRKMGDENHLAINAAVNRNNELPDLARDACRHASLFWLASKDIDGMFVPKDIVKLIAKEVYATRAENCWLFLAFQLYNLNPLYPSPLNEKTLD